MFDAETLKLMKRIHNYQHCQVSNKDCYHCKMSALSTNLEYPLYPWANLYCNHEKAGMMLADYMKYIEELIIS